MHDWIYFDNAATTRCDPRVVESMMPYLSERFGNPASHAHPYGWEADEAVELAREQVAALIGGKSSDVIFTSGATEANNLVLKGIFGSGSHEPGHFVTTSIEHSAILEPAESLARQGVEVTRVEPDANGWIDPERVLDAIRPNTRLVSVIHGNNEIGVLQDIGSIAQICASRSVPFHTDATQSAGKVLQDLVHSGADLISISAHKIYGPKGTGALYVNRKRMGTRLRPSIEGGGQERGLRSGTPNVPGIVGFGRASELAKELCREEGTRIRSLRVRLETLLMDRLPGTEFHGRRAERLPGITNVHFDGISVESMTHALVGVAFSAGSACASKSAEPSHVLLALGLPPETARNSLRFSLGRFNTIEEVDSVIQRIIDAVEDLRRRMRESSS